MADLPVTRLVETLIAATKLAATRGQVISVTPSASLEEIEKELVRSGIDPMRMLAEAALLAFSADGGRFGSCDEKLAEVPSCRHAARGNPPICHREESDMGY